MSNKADLKKVREENLFLHKRLIASERRENAWREAAEELNRALDEQREYVCRLEAAVENAKAALVVLR